MSKKHNLTAEEPAKETAALPKSSLQTTTRKLARDYDMSAKRMLQERQILAWLLIQCVPEFAGLTLAQAMAWIEPAGKMNDKDLHGKAVNFEQQEVLDDKVKTCFDILFAAAGKSGKPLRIDIEIQEKLPTGYKLARREAVYIARLVSSQLVKPVKTGYRNLTKVDSIWLLRRPPKKDQGLIRRLSVKTEEIRANAVRVVPTVPVDDWFTIIELRLPEPDEENFQDWMTALNTLLDYETKRESREQILRKIGIVVNEDISKKISEMCKIGNGISYRSKDRWKIEAKAEMAWEQLKLGASAEFIAKTSGLTKAVIKKLKDTLPTGGAFPAEMFSNAAKS